jgi:methylthioribose-1-phosphate isomerase
MLPTIEWTDDAIVMVDQRKLPGEETYVRCRNAQEVAKAIKTMVIRGAPAIGVAAAMGLALCVRQSKATGTQKLAVEFYRMCDLMAGTRPTAPGRRRCRADRRVALHADSRHRNLLRRNGRGCRRGR